MNYDGDFKLRLHFYLHAPLLQNCLMLVSEVKVQLRMLSANHLMELLNDYEESLASS